MTAASVRAMFENAVRGASAAAPNRRIIGVIRRRAVPGMRSVRGVVSVLIVLGMNDQVLQKDSFVACFQLVTDSIL